MVARGVAHQVGEQIDHLIEREIADGRENAKQNSRDDYERSFESRSSSLVGQEAF
jgi:hypothetical protein